MKKCCNNPDVKNEGYVIVSGKKIWEYYCYACHKNWTEKELEGGIKNG